MKLNFNLRNILRTGCLEKCSKLCSAVERVMVRRKFSSEVPAFLDRFQKQSYGFSGIFPGTALGLTGTVHETVVSEIRIFGYIKKTVFRVPERFQTGL